MFGSLFGARGRNSQSLDLTDPRFPKAWCVFALLYCCVWSDGNVQNEEEVEVDALLTRARSLMPIAPDMVEVYVQQFEEHLSGANSVYGLVDFACEKLPREPGVAEAVFAHCLDLVLSDRRVIDVEQQFLDHLAAALGVRERDRDDITQVMQWKHGY